jgi:O-antigen/teichoic acid export membrane protein
VNVFDQLARTKASVMSMLLSDGLRGKAARGGARLGSAGFIEQLCRFARNMLLARLLAPGAFGEMALITSAAALVNSFTDVGILPAIIQNRRGATQPYLNAAWWMGMVRSVLIYVTVFIAAPWIAHFYRDPDLPALLRVALLNVVFEGLLSPRAKLAQKEMKFGRWAFINNGGGICGVLLAIALSFELRNVWALAIGFAAENAFRCLFSYILYPGLPSIRVEKEVFKDLLTFSRGMVGLSLLNLLFARSDIFVLGRTHASTSLGLYALAVSLAQTPATFVLKLVAQTLLPTFCHVQSEPERMNRMLTEITSWMILCGVPVVTMVGLCSSSLLTLAYGHRYGVAPAATALTLAAAVAFLNILNGLITNVFFAIGEPALHRRAVAVSAIVMVAIVYPCCMLFGIAGGQFAALIAIVASYLLQVLRLRHITGLNLPQYTRAFVPAVLGSISIVIVGEGAHLLGLAANPFANIAVTLGACLVACFWCVPLFLRFNRFA